MFLSSVKSRSISTTFYRFLSLLKNMQTPKKVSNACQRCRRQKLKVCCSPFITTNRTDGYISPQCDVQRPCTLCTRAGVNCQGAATSPWKVYDPGSGQSNSRVRPARRLTRSRPGPESPRPGSDGLTLDDSRGHGTASPAPVALTRTNEHLSPGNEPLHSSSTISLVDGVSPGPVCFLSRAKSE